MSLFNRLTYWTLWGELVLYSVSLLPLSFIPARMRRDGMEWVSKITSNETLRWTANIIFLIVFGVFMDTVVRLTRLEHEHTTDTGMDASAAHHYDTAYHELADKARRFYAQRNMYMSLFALFMVLVLYRRFKDVYRMTVLQLELESAKAAISVAAAAGAAGAAAVAAEATCGKGRSGESDNLVGNDIQMEDMRDKHADAQLRRRRAD